jgi:hypothetical protein
MKKWFCFFSLVLLLGACTAFQSDADPYLVVTSSNDENDNQLLVYDENGKQVQALSTQGQGGVAPHIVGGGVTSFNDYVGVINYGSQSVSLFKRDGDTFKLLQVIPTLTKPVSVAFGNGHLYVLGTTTIESHKMNGDTIVENPDGSARLLSGDGSAAQVGVLSNQLIISERSNMLELADLIDGTVTGTINPVQLPPAPKNKTPVGLVTRGQDAYVTIAHSDEVGLVRNGKLITVVSSGDQHAPCWLTLQGQSLFCSNTPSKSISRYKVSGDSIFLEEPIAIKTEGEPTDIAIDGEVLAALELGNPASISQFRVDSNGKLTLLNRTPTSSNANGVAIVSWK